MQEQVATTCPAATAAQIAKLKEGQKPWPERAITVDYDFYVGEGENTVELVGEKEVRHFFYKGAKVNLQSNVRRWLRAGKSDNEIKELVTKFKLVISTGTRKTVAEKIGDLFKGMSREQKVAHILELRKTAGLDEGKGADPKVASS